MWMEGLVAHCMKQCKKDERKESLFHYFHFMIFNLIGRKKMWMFFERKLTNNCNFAIKQSRWAAWKPEAVKSGVLMHNFFIQTMDPARCITIQNHLRVLCFIIACPTRIQQRIFNLIKQLSAPLILKSPGKTKTYGPSLSISSSHSFSLSLNVSLYPLSLSPPPAPSDKYISLNSESNPPNEKGHQYPLVYFLLHAVTALHQVSSSEDISHEREGAERLPNE